ncbi:MAG: hypothetical protein COA69_12975 [Robiginitomaculum sp.]|nr:MAG: hypothetical protein COA69_12975 [Robiginitomaculum sp.]
MSKQKRERLFSLHSLLGLCVAFILYVVCFSGTYAVFTASLTRWENPEISVQYEGAPASIDAEYEAFIDSLPDTAKIPMVITYYPTPDMPFYKVQALVSAGGPPKPTIAQFSAANGERLEARGTSLSQWMAYFHTDLWLPYPLGRSLIGISGLLLLLMVISGLYMNNKLVKRSFLWRPDKSLKLLLLDSHNMLGLWGFLFHGVIAFSGAVLGLGALSGVIFGALVLGPGEHAHLEPLEMPQLESHGEMVPSITPDRVLQISKSVSGEIPALGILVNNGKDNAVVRIYYEVEKPLVSYGVLDLNGVTGEVIAHNPTPQSIIPRLYISVRPLHTGAFGGVWLKILYGVLGAILCLIILSGILMWLERTSATLAKVGKASSISFMFMEKLSVGVCVGFPVATLLSIYVDQMMVVEAARRAYWVGVSVFTIWGFAALYACALKTHTSLRALLGIACIALFGLPILNLVGAGGFVSASLIPNAVFISLAGILVFVIRKLPKTLA